MQDLGLGVATISSGAKTHPMPNFRGRASQCDETIELGPRRDEKAKGLYLKYEAALKAPTRTCRRVPKADPLVHGDERPQGRRRQRSPFTTPEPEGR